MQRLRVGVQARSERFFVAEAFPVLGFASPQLGELSLEQKSPSHKRNHPELAATSPKAA